MSQPLYDSDLTDEEWQHIEPLLPTAKPLSKYREVNLRDILNTIFYRADGGIKWRAMPCVSSMPDGVWVPPIMGQLGSLGANQHHCATASGQVIGVLRGDVPAQLNFMAKIFGVVA